MFRHHLTVQTPVKFLKGKLYRSFHVLTSINRVERLVVADCGCTMFRGALRFERLMFAREECLLAALALELGVRLVGTEGEILITKTSLHIQC